MGTSRIFYKEYAFIQAEWFYLLMDKVINKVKALHKLKIWIAILKLALASVEKNMKMYYMAGNLRFVRLSFREKK